MSRPALPFAAALARWYPTVSRDLPWRRTRDPYRIWVSEIMLQQTRAQAVIPYYERFLARFPDVAALAAAEEHDVLACWSGLGYYSRARNLQKAARAIAAAGAFPQDYSSIRALPGVGDYTAAAIASIAFGLPYAVLDGNVLRVIARVTNDPSDAGSPTARKRFREAAQHLLDPRDPSGFNQALMELGATVCLPRKPQCLLCPVAPFCGARAAGTAEQLPVKLAKAGAHRIEADLVLLERRGRIALWRRGPDSPRMAGFWELPAPAGLPGLQLGGAIGSFRHTITRYHYRFVVYSARIRRLPQPLCWLDSQQIAALPLSTVARKALRLAGIVPKLL